MLASLAAAARKSRSFRDTSRASYRDPWGGQAIRANEALDIETLNDVVTDFYEYSWGQSFHFAALRKGDTLQQAIDRHEDWLAVETGLHPGLRVLDLGCGVGGPMRHLAKKTGAHITGVNLDATQVARAQSRAEAEGLSGLISVEQADFADLPFADQSFDVVLAIESTCHASDRLRVFEEAHRVLKPGGRFAGYDWCTTDAFDPNRFEHTRLIRTIELGNAVPPLASTHVVYEALYVAGFEIREGYDAAEDCDVETPWWTALEGGGDFPNLPRTPVRRAVTKAMVQTLELLRVAPRGTTAASITLNRTLDAIAAAGRLGIFTPMYRWSAIRPF